MASLQVKTFSFGALAQGASAGFAYGFRGGVVSVTALPPSRVWGAALAVENLRVTMVRDEFSDPENRLSCTVKNVGTGSVQSYSVNVAHFTP